MSSCTTSASCSITWSGATDADRYELQDVTGGRVKVIASVTSPIYEDDGYFYECPEYTLRVVAFEGSDSMISPQNTTLRFPATGEEL